ncbi:unnamed protein product [Thlaspi arvense]|uniref:RING-type domain-containing protein n=1 Tax=Thlaspi arvense TaxID=13288 RepID=A0AAU9S9Z5_THLAR|nr:unnamed protein product [Thlaspi arvense]
MEIKIYLFDQNSVHPSSLNKVLINLSHRFERFTIDESDGTLTCTGFYAAPPLPISQISLSLKSYESNPNHLVPVSEESKCAICLEGLWNDEDDVLNSDLLPCSHRFHMRCVGEWLMRSNSCPLCREIVYEESYEADF